MIQQVEEHHNDEDIIKLSMSSDIKKWKAELDFNDREVAFLRQLLNSGLIEKIRANPEDARFLLSQLTDFQEANDSQVKTLIAFQNKLEGMKECDDVECETYYVKDHLVLKSSIEKHFRSFRTVKDFVYTYLDRELRVVGKLE